MRRAVSIVVATLLAGCAGEAPQPPVLANPKVLVDRDAENQTHVYVHSAFGDRIYERIHVRVDNATVADEAHTYAVDVRVPQPTFHLAIDVNSTRVNWTLVALVELDGEEASGAFAVWDPREETFDAARDAGLPWQKILDEAREEADGT